MRRVSDAARLDTVRPQVMQRLGAGVKVAHIAAEFRVSTSAFRNWCRRREIAVPPAGSGARLLAEHTDEVSAMVKIGKPYQEIAAAFGVSKNTVMGWCHRNGLSAARAEPPTASVPPPLSRKRIASRNTFKLTGERYPTPLNGTGVPFMDARKDQCSRPLWGDDATTGNVCGHPVAPGLSYCRECANQLYEVLPSSKKKNFARDAIFTSGRDYTQPSNYHER